jgi:hypothetical protein
MQGAVAAGAGFLFRFDEAVLAGQVFRQGAAIVVARRLRLLLGLLLPIRFRLGIHRGQGLGDVFEGQFELVGRQPLGAAAELMALQLDDDGAQFVALGQGAVELVLVIVPFALQRRRFGRSINEHRNELIFTHTGQIVSRIHDMIVFILLKHASK